MNEDSETFTPPTTTTKARSRTVKGRRWTEAEVSIHVRADADDDTLKVIAGFTATTLPGLAVCLDQVAPNDRHFNRGSCLCVITHLASGMAVMRLSKLADAFAAAEILGGLGIDWSAGELEVCRAVQDLEEDSRESRLWTALMGSKTEGLRLATKILTDEAQADLELPVGDILAPDLSRLIRDGLKAKPEALMAGAWTADIRKGDAVGLGKIARYLNMLPRTTTVVCGVVEDGEIGRWKAVVDTGAGATRSRAVLYIETMRWERVQALAA